jgi:hypothetical protein
MQKNNNETLVTASIQTIVPASQETRLDKFSRCGKSGSLASASPSAACSQLLKNPKLRGWERLFIKTLAASHNPGRKQIAKLEAIALRLGYSLAEEGGEV